MGADDDLSLSLELPQVRDDAVEHEGAAAVTLVCLYAVLNAHYHWVTHVRPLIDEAKRYVWISVSVVGGALAALGLLWFLQGSDVVHIDPILCTDDCEPVMGHQPSWQVAGAVVVVVVVGGALTAVGLRKLPRA